jgi:protein FAM50
LKNEEIQITFSFWDGSGHRRMLTMKKGKTIYQFLQKALEDLRSDFLELRSARFQITKKRQKLLNFFL